MTELTSCFSGTYLARSPQRIPKPMPPTMDMGPCTIWKTRASGKQKYRLKSFKNAL